MTEKELRAAITSGMYENVRLGYQQQDMNIEINGESISVGKYGSTATAFYCIKVELTEEQYKAMRLRALHRAIETKKEECMEIEHEIAELQSAS